MYLANLKEFYLLLLVELSRNHFQKIMNRQNTWFDPMEIQRKNLNWLWISILVIFNK